VEWGVTSLPRQADDEKRLYNPLLSRRIIMVENYKEMAVNFLKLASSGAVQEAYSRLVGPGFKHHNPFFEGTAAALLAGMEENARLNPGKIFEIKQVIGENNFVVTHSHVRQKQDDLGAMVVHIFRFENGRIVELWDVGQPVPKESLNQFGMF
jgi:predicted SnoaL-like aldol condensation-catalyzing enzyme